ncbi:MAG: hypothetical protein ABIH76_06820 [Candidatus Bathyarchaeota archaeon]
MFVNFSVYDFKLTYPDDWNVLINDRLITPRNGNITFMSPEGFNINLTWRPLREVKRKYPTVNESADHMIDYMGKKRVVKSLRIVNRENISLLGHESILDSLELLEEVGGTLWIPGPKVLNECMVFQVYCEETDLFFIIFSEPTRKEEWKLRKVGKFKEYDENAETFHNVVKSFRCHN